MTDLAKLVDDLSKLTILEAADLSKQLEEKWGVSAAPIAVAAANNSGSEAKQEEQTEFDVILKAIGGNKIAVIKKVREITGLGLTQAKAVVDGAPKAVKESVSKEEAEKVKAALEEAGAEVVLQ